MNSAQTVPFLDLRANYERHRTEFDNAFRDVVANSDFVLGNSLATFEAAFGAYCGRKHAVGCASGTDALELAMEAAGIGPGDEVITVSHTFAATVSSILRTGGTPVLLDVSRDTLLIDSALLEAAITPKTVAIVVVHLYGSVCPMNLVLEVADRHGLAVIEDAAQAHGATWRGAKAGSIGHLGCFSFYPGKNLGAFGDGGMVITDDDGFANILRQIRDHGKPDKFSHAVVGRNSRLDGIQAAVLAVKLQYLDEENDDRRRAFAHYAEAISNIGLPVELVTVPEETVPVHHLGVVKTPYRDVVKSYLERGGIQVGIHYPVPLHRQPAFQSRVRLGSQMSVTESACSEILSLPIFPYITKLQQDQVVRVLEAAFNDIQLLGSRS